MQFPEYLLVFCSLHGRMQATCSSPVMPFHLKPRFQIPVLAAQDWPHEYVSGDAYFMFSIIIVTLSFRSAMCISYIPTLSRLKIQLSAVPLL